MRSKNLVCVLCGAPWQFCANVCESCGGFSTWGESKGGPPSSWDVTDKGWTPKPPPAKREGGATE